MMKRLSGIAASRGIATGLAFQFRRADRCFERCVMEDPAAERMRFQAALELDSPDAVQALVRERVPAANVM
jgi:hypothetical protein